MDINQLAFPHGRLPKDLPLKNVLLKYISQIHCMVQELDVEGSSKRNVEDTKKHQLELQDAQILKLKAQVCELGEYNEDLSAQLRKESMEGLEDEEDLQLKSESIEPITNNVAIYQLDGPKRIEYTGYLAVEGIVVFANNKETLIDFIHV
uniref:Predicted protein n=1 Tax=Physcomitrium patens TaxID=3218 RepID=A9U4A3_PHYPA